MRNKLIALLVMVSLTSVANAGVLLEPYFSLVLTGKSSKDCDLKFSGNTLGARVGWSMLGFSVGLDALLAGTVTGKTDLGTSDIKPTGYGVFAAYAFPVLVRAYFSYFLSYTGKTDTTDYLGTGNKLGVQFTGLPFIAIGLEAETVSIKEAKVGSVKLDYSETLTFTNLVISAPFSF